MRVGKVEITPQSGASGEILIAFEQVEANNGLDEVYLINAVCGNKTAQKLIYVKGALQTPGMRQTKSGGLRLTSNGGIRLT
ncbi:MAG: hypothetical protein LBR26_09430 [Prevotella sp.]|jgi:hypothetical protein|nr:hypothetical protein [Prevotella sp.]